MNRKLKKFYNYILELPSFDRLAGTESGGVALVLVIWIMVMLVALVGEFSYSMRTEIKITRNFKEEEEAYQLALAGIEKAKVEIISVADLRGIYVNENGVLILDPEEEAPDRSEELGNGSFTYDINDEDGKLNINIATDQQLKNIFLESGVDIEKVDIIVDSILDWIDENDLHRLNGAEEDYYRSLDRPYSCKDGKFSSIEELLLVRGMTPEILYGSAGNEGENVEEDKKYYSGVIEYLTVRGTDRVNANTAPVLVLEAVFGPEMADNIIVQRESGPLYRAIANSKVDSQYFTIVSTGKNSDGSIKRKVKTAVQRQANDLVTLYWNDNVIE